MMQKPFGVLGIEGEEAVERREIALCDRSAKGEEFGIEARGFLAIEEIRAGEAAQNDVGGDQVDEDQAALCDTMGVALAVRSLKDHLSAEEMAVCEEVAAEVIEIGDPLGGREERQRRRLLIDVAEDLLRAAQLAAMEEELEAQIRGHVNPDPAAFGLAIGVIDARRGTAPFAKALLERLTDHVGRALDQSHPFSRFLIPDAAFLPC